MSMETIEKFVDQEDVYGDEVQRKHAECRNCCVLIDIDKSSQCGIILACGACFCYVLTVRNPAFISLRNKIFVTFGDGLETEFETKNIHVKSSKNLSILFLHSGINPSQAKKAVEFCSEDDIKEAVLYTLSYFPKSSFFIERFISTPAASYFRGGNLGVEGVQDNGVKTCATSVESVQDNGVEVFYHNCSAGFDINTGSGVLNGMSQIIGINLDYSSGWFMAMNLAAVKREIVDMLPGTRNKSFADIKVYLEAKGAAEVYKRCS